LADSGRNLKTNLKNAAVVAAGRREKWKKGALFIAIF
jgi:hypothetical protein